MSSSAIVWISQLCFSYEFRAASGNFLKPQHHLITDDVFQDEIVVKLGCCNTAPTKVELSKSRRYSAHTVHYISIISGKIILVLYIYHGSLQYLRRIRAVQDNTIKVTCKNLNLTQLYSLITCTFFLNFAAHCPKGTKTTFTNIYVTCII